LFGRVPAQTYPATNINLSVLMLGGSEIPKCRIVQVTPDRAYAILNNRYFGTSKSVWNG